MESDKISKKVYLEVIFEECLEGLGIEKAMSKIIESKNKLIEDGCIEESITLSGCGDNDMLGGAEEKEIYLTLEGQRLETDEEFDSRIERERLDRLKESELEDLTRIENEDYERSEYERLKRKFGD